MRTSNLLPGWREEEYGRSRGGLPLRVQLPAHDGPVEGLLVAVQHGEEAETGLVARRLLERVPADENAWAVVQVANPDGLLAGTRLPVPKVTGEGGPTARCARHRSRRSG